MAGYILFITTNPQQVFVESVTFEILDKNYLSFMNYIAILYLHFGFKKKMATLQGKTCITSTYEKKKKFRLDRMLPGRSEFKPIYLSQLERQTLSSATGIQNYFKILELI